MQIFIDADACPVKEEALAVAYRYNVKLFLVSNQWLRLPVGDNVEKIVVNDGFDAADDWIVENAGAGDVVVTGDILLASRCLENGSNVIGHNGKPFTSDNIGMAVAMRELKSQLRDMGEDKGYNKSFTKDDRSRFSSALNLIVEKAVR
ncbi:YaiI/YqxD family protein [Kordiimonas sp. SCSIO 12610]|uniref:YaiI/YqxD family protein n=1 Tax=Kordiimonas sp. SCSIO 12610 TaxID=2829597 RepID=UPI00210BF2A1|nr:YaiI/YqxD family protein [Kordiimonas sp. SCSIO 12610]UTW56380.1 YaiI/YqxD family protein [Kordiimonas sp. SCSIO 12610]